MQFSQDFWNDVEEAFAYWVVRQQDASQQLDPSLTATKWAARILGQSVYALIADKRAMHNSEPNSVEEKGRQEEAESH